MRDPARIDQVLDVLRRVWMQNPDYRLGQLIVNAVRPQEPSPAVFNIEDTVLVRRLQRLGGDPQAPPDG